MLTQHHFWYYDPRATYRVLPPVAAPSRTRHASPAGLPPSPSCPLRPSAKTGLMLLVMPSPRADRHDKTPTLKRESAPFASLALSSVACSYPGRWRSTARPDSDSAGQSPLIPAVALPVAPVRFSSAAGCRTASRRLPAFARSRWAGGCRSWSARRAPGPRARRERELP